MKKTEPLQRCQKYRVLKKMFLIMRLLILMFFIALMQVSAGSYSQMTRLNLKFENETLESVFSKIEAKSEFSIFYKNDLIKNSGKVSGSFENSRIFDILNQVLANSGLDYIVRDKLVMIISREEGTGREVDLGELEVIQQKSVSGRVTDKTGSPLPGVTVIARRIVTSGPSIPALIPAVRSSSRSTIAISIWAKLAPMQRRRPPPKGIQV